MIIIAAAASEPEAKEGSSSLIGKILIFHLQIFEQLYTTLQVVTIC